jgi:hypothetical protein
MGMREWGMETENRGNKKDPNDFGSLSALVGLLWLEHRTSSM